MIVEIGDIITIVHRNIDKDELYKVTAIKRKGSVRVEKVKCEWGKRYDTLNVHQDLVKVYLKRHDIIDTRERIKNWLYK